MIDKLENNAPFAAPKSLTLIWFIHVYLVTGVQPPFLKG
jgi:hypothetical protein